MAWETGEGGVTVGGTRIVSIVDGVERAFTFDGGTLLKDVVQGVATQMNFGSVLVKADGRNVEPTEGDSAVSTFQRVEILPKYSGASEGDETPSNDEEQPAKDESPAADEIAYYDD